MAVSIELTTTGCCSTLDHSTTEGIAANAVPNTKKMARHRGAPVVLVVEELVAVVEEHARALLVLLEPLHGGAREEAAVGRVDAPRQVAHHLLRRGRVKLVQLAVEGVEDGVQPCADEPVARELGRVKRRHQRLRLRLLGGKQGGGVSGTGGAEEGQVGGAERQGIGADTVSILTS